MRNYNDGLRIRISGDRAIVGPRQRAELSRLVGEAFGVVPRIVQAYFTLAGTRRQFLQATANEDDFRSRVVLAKCLTLDPAPDSPRVQWERVQSSDPADSSYNSLRDLLYGTTAAGELSNWNFNSAKFNAYDSSTAGQETSFFLQWDYEYVFVPDWVPVYLRPFDGIDPNPYRPA